MGLIHADYSGHCQNILGTGNFVLVDFLLVEVENKEDNLQRKLSSISIIKLELY